MIYASGAVVMRSSSLCVVPSCAPDDFDPNTKLLVFVAGGDAAIYGEGGIAPTFQGAVYAVAHFTAQHASRVQGPVIADRLNFQNTSASVDWTPIEAMPIGTPSANSKTTIQPVSWSG